MNEFFYASSLLIIALISLLAVAHSGFKDNFGQFIGLAIMCIASSVRFWEVLTQSVVSSQSNARWALTHGLAIYAISTLYKYWREAKRKQAGK